MVICPVSLGWREAGEIGETWGQRPCKVQVMNDSWEIRGYLPQIYCGAWDSLDQFLRWNEKFDLGLSVGRSSSDCLGPYDLDNKIVRIRIIIIPCGYHLLSIYYVLGKNELSCFFTATFWGWQPFWSVYNKKMVTQGIKDADLRGRPWAISRPSQGGEKTDFSCVHSSALPTHGLRN